MSENIQSLIEKINREGVEKAEAEAARIISAAEQKAKDIIATANAEAAKAASESQKAAESYSQRSQDTIKQAARDIVLSVKSSIESVLDKLLCSAVSESLEKEETLTAFIDSSIKGISSGEVFCGAKIADALAKSLAAKGEFKVILDEKLGNGFSVRVDGGRVEHSFSEEVIARELSRLLRPDLAKLLQVGS
jgi:V/A-type H+-transporting ATPase subunit E